MDKEDLECFEELLKSFPDEDLKAIVRIIMTEDEHREKERKRLRWQNPVRT